MNPQSPEIVGSGANSTDCVASEDEKTVVTRPPSLEVFIDLPNFERSLKREGLPFKLDMRALSQKIAANVYGTTYHLKRVSIFTATDLYDANGAPQPEGHHAALAGIAGVHFTYGHRMAPAGAGTNAMSGARKSDEGREKGVDVALAISMMERACDGTFDAAVLIANDSDYCNLIERVRARGKSVYWAHLYEQRNHVRMQNACTKPILLSNTLVKGCPLPGGR